MRSFGIGLLHLFIGVIITFGWITFADERRMIVRPMDMVTNTLIPMGVFIITAAVHGYYSGARRRMP